MITLCSVIHLQKVDHEHHYRSKDSDSIYVKLNLDVFSNSSGVFYHMGQHNQNIVEIMNVKIFNLIQISTNKRQPTSRPHEGKMYHCLNIKLWYLQHHSLPQSQWYVYFLFILTVLWWNSIVFTSAYCFSTYHSDRDKTTQFFHLVSAWDT